MGSTERRNAPRRQKALRFRFEGDGHRQRAVSVNVSATGAFLKASWVPATGSRVALNEVVASSDGPELGLIGDVIWGSGQPTLARPEPGFAIRFVEISCPGGREVVASIEAMVRVLDPDLAPSVREESGPDGLRRWVHRFAEAPPVPRNRNPASRPVLRASSAFPKRAASVSDELPMQRRPTADLVPVPDAEEPLPAPQVVPSGTMRRNGNRRRLTGIFTALFTRTRAMDVTADVQPGATALAAEGEGASLDEVFGRMEPDPGFAGAGHWGEGQVRVGWRDVDTRARVDRITPTMLSLTTNGEVPLYYERVTIRPLSAEHEETKLVIYGTVTRIKDPDIHGDQTFSVRFTRVDERGNAGVFQDYMRALGGRE